MYLKNIKKEKNGMVGGDNEVVFGEEPRRARAVTWIFIHVEQMFVPRTLLFQCDRLHKASPLCNSCISAFRSSKNF